MIRHRQLRTEDGTVLEEDEELNKVFEGIGNLTENQREVMNNASTFTDGRAEEIERLQARNEQLAGELELIKKQRNYVAGLVDKKVKGLHEQIDGLKVLTRAQAKEVTMLRERLTRWAKVITKMYEQVTQEILF